jgi:hypothetical protein
MANTIITKNSATATAVPTAGQLVQGELAVNVTDKRLFTENSGGTVVEVGTNPSTIAVAGNATVGGTLGVTGLATLASSTLTANPTLSAGTANGVAYLNGSKVLTSGSALTFDGTTFGVNNGVAGGAALSLTGTYTGAGSVAFLNFQRVGGAVAGTLGYNDANNSIQFGTTTNHSTIFLQNNAEAMRLTSTGLGIGTSSPISKLTVLGAGTINAPETTTTGGSIQTASYGITTRTGNLELGATDALAANIGGSLSFSARYSGTNATWVTGKIGAYRDTATSGVASSYLAFATTTGAGDLTERLRLDSSGNLGLGVTPSAWRTAYETRAIQVGPVASIFSLSASETNNYAGFKYNNYQQSDGNNIYLKSNFATEYRQANGAHQWLNAPSGTAGNAISFTQAMTLDASGQLGIGATSPSANLDIVTPTGTAKIKVGNNTLAGGSYLNLQGASGSKTWFVASNYNIGGALEFIQSTANGGSTPAGTASMLIDSSGNVGIGTSSPAFKLDVSGSIRANTGYFRSTNTYTVFTGADILGTTGGITSIGANPIVFGTDGTERARIDSSGNLLVGVTSANGTEKFSVTSASTEVAFFQNSSNTSGYSGIRSQIGSSNTSTWHFRGETRGYTNYYLYGNGTTSYSSDIRLKKNVQTARGYLEDLNKLRVVKYQWKGEDPDCQQVELGLIAQEVEEVFPNLIQEHEVEGVGNMKHIKQSVLPFMMLKAIQEQQAIIESLTARVSALEGN